MQLEAVQVLLEHNTDTNSQCSEGKTPLYLVLANGDSEGKVVDIMQRLLEHGADPNIRANDNSAPLHQASLRGWLAAARLLLSYGAKVDEKDGKGETPFQKAALKDMTK
jgi:ankyrin repeat protein